MENETDTGSAAEGSLPDELTDLRPPTLQRPVRLIVERLDDLSLDGPVTLGKIIESFGRTSFLPMMLIPALLLVSPLSGIPLFSSFCGFCIVLVALQRLAQRDRLWLPGFLTRLNIDGAKLHRAVGALRKVADWLDRHSRPRLKWLVTPPLNMVSYGLCVLCGLTIPFLELVPFSSSLLGAVVSLVVVGLMVRDGVYVVAAITLAGFALSLPVFLVSQVVN